MKDEVAWSWTDGLLMLACHGEMMVKNSDRLWSVPRRCTPVQVLDGCGKRVKLSQVQWENDR